MKEFHDVTKFILNVIYILLIFALITQYLTNEMLLEQLKHKQKCYELSKDIKCFDLKYS